MGGQTSKYNKHGGISVQLDGYSKMPGEEITGFVYINITFCYFAFNPLSKVLRKRKNEVD